MAPDADWILSWGRFTTWGARLVFGLRALTPVPAVPVTYLVKSFSLPP